MITVTFTSLMLLIDFKVESIDKTGFVHYLPTDGTVELERIPNPYGLENDWLRVKGTTHGEDLTFWETLNGKYFTLKGLNEFMEELENV